jgi:hypothetical protein
VSWPKCAFFFENLSKLSESVFDEVVRSNDQEDAGLSNYWLVGVTGMELQARKSM